MQYERQARTALLKERRQAEQDRVARAHRHARQRDDDDLRGDDGTALRVRLGINLRLLDDMPATTVNELFIHTQPAHLQKLIGHPLDGEERNAQRAKYLKARLRELGSHRQ